MQIDDYATQYTKETALLSKKFGDSRTKKNQIDAESLPNEQGFEIMKIPYRPLPTWHDTYGTVC